MLTRPNEQQRWAVWGFLGKQPIYLWGAGGALCSFLVSTLLHAWTATDKLVMQIVAPRGRSHGSPGRRDLAGGGGPLSPLSELRQVGGWAHLWEGLSGGCHTRPIRPSQPPRGRMCRGGATGRRAAIVNGVAHSGPISFGKATLLSLHGESRFSVC